MTDRATLPKYRAISEDLTNAIRSGRYRPGDRLPTERELADQYNVHRMTVRQATNALVRAGLVIKRRPAGIFVRESCQGDIATRPLNLITTADESGHVGVFLEHGVAIARENGYHPRVLRIYPGNEHLAADAVLSPDPSIFLGLNPDPRDEIGQAIRQAGDRVVVAGARLDHAGIHSIVADDEFGQRLAVEYLARRGHRRIGMLCSQYERGEPMMEIQIQYWRKAMIGSGLTVSEQDIILLQHVEFGGHGMAARQAVTRYLQERSHDRATALICLSEPAARGAAVACYHQGMNIPEAMSLIVYAGAYSASLHIPPLTCIDVNLKRHVDLAVQAINNRNHAPARGNGVDERPRLHVIQPKLVERDSVADHPEDHS